MKMVEGQYYVMFIPPGWLFAGRVASVDGDSVTLDDSSYLELAGEDRAPLAELPKAKTAAEQKKICSRSWPMAKGVILQSSAILIAVPSVDLSSTTKADDADTIRKAK
jgi:hypothetical protein